MMSSILKVSLLTLMVALAAVLPDGEPACAAEIRPIGRAAQENPAPKEGKAPNQAKAPPKTNQAKAKDDAKAKDPEFKNITWVIIQLRLEARKSLKFKKQWPRIEANFAEEKNVRTDEVDLFRVLAKRLDQDSAMDGYIRWQLLSFKPKFEQVDERSNMFRRLIVTMPRVIAQPEPKIPKQASSGVSMTIGTQVAVLVDRIPVPGRGRFASYRPVLGVATIGSGFGGRQTANGFVFEADADNATEQLQRARVSTDYANAPTLTYRDLLVSQVSAKAGLRFGATLQDAYDRVKAGERSSAEVVDLLIAESEALKENPTVSTDRLRAFYDEVLKLFKVYHDVAVSVYLENGQFKVDRESVDFPRTKLQKILANIREATKLRGLEQSGK
jgi:hypothetical protein